MRGILRSLYRYPIKSLLGETLTHARLGERGMNGDRAFAFLDTQTGKIASAKEPKRWSPLLRLRAHYELPDARIDTTYVRVLLPDGRSLCAADESLAEVVSQLLGRSVTLSSASSPDAVIERVTPEGEDGAGTMVDLKVAGGAPAGTWFDFAPVHFVSTASLRALEAHHPKGRASEALRFRPNLVIDLDGAEGFEESQWLDRVVCIGETKLRVISATPRCAVPTLAHGDSIAADPDLIRTLARNNRVPVPGFGDLACLGAYATVIEAGAIREGDAVVLE